MSLFKVCSLVAAPLADGKVYAYFYPKDFESIFGKKMKESENVKRYVCISKGKKKVYKLYHGMNMVPEGMIALDYESQSCLGAFENGSVNVCPICKFNYDWHTSSSLPMISLIIGIFSIILAIVLKIFL